jgi:hypothetical protein
MCIAIIRELGSNLTISYDDKILLVLKKSIFSRKNRTPDILNRDIKHKYVANLQKYQQCLI